MRLLSISFSTPSTQQNIYDESNPMFRPFMTQWMTQFLQSKLPTIPHSHDAILVHVVRRSAGDRPEAEREVDAESSESFESASANTLDEVITCTLLFFRISCFCGLKIVFAVEFVSGVHSLLVT